MKQNRYYEKDHFLWTKWEKVLFKENVMFLSSACKLSHMTVIK